ncbi:MAG TPA: type II toxin-antitoxin system RelE/ParE family toxin [Gammaproteobacteria bacterium]|nr:type II toxin-antitoxin system RelE/ParE family toxin [Gammaproteobacteria bacterium]
MFEIHKSRRACADIHNIWLYSFENWGEAQADKYFDQLMAGINELRRHPELGKPRDSLRKGYRSLQIQHHVVFYTVSSSIVSIKRVLHERMDPDAGL